VPQLLTIRGGGLAMIESPLPRGLAAEAMQRDILIVFQVRSGPTPPGIQALLQAIMDEA